MEIIDAKLKKNNNIGERFIYIYCIIAKTNHINQNLIFKPYTQLYNITE